MTKTVKGSELEDLLSFLRKMGVELPDISPGEEVEVRVMDDEERESFIRAIRDGGPNFTCLTELGMQMTQVLDHMGCAAIAITKVKDPQKREEMSHLAMHKYSLALLDVLERVSATMPCRKNGEHDGKADGCSVH